MAKCCWFTCSKSKSIISIINLNSATIHHSIHSGIRRFHYNRPFLPFWVKPSLHYLVQERPHSIRVTRWVLRSVPGLTNELFTTLRLSERFVARVIYIKYTCLSVCCFCLCSKGIQRRTVKCKRKDDGSIVADAVCKKGSAVKPEDEKPCNTQPCPPEYVTNTVTLRMATTFKFFKVSCSNNKNEKMNPQYDQSLPYAYANELKSRI